MTSDMGHNKEILPQEVLRQEVLSPQTTYTPKYEEYEDDNPNILDLSYPGHSPEDHIKIAQWKINRVFYFLYFTAIASTGAVIIEPKQFVEIAAVAIWISSVGLARYLLGSAYHKRGVSHKT